MAKAEYPIDFRVKRDAWGWYVVAYRVKGGVEQVWETSEAIGARLNLTPKDFEAYLKDVYGGEEETRNRRVRFTTREAAVACREGLRALLPKAVATGNLFV